MQAHGQRVKGDAQACRKGDKVYTL